MKHCDSSVLSPSVLLSFKALQQAIRRILWGAPKMIKIKAISALSKTCHWSKGLKVDTHYILPQVDLSDQKIRCWQSSFFELLCLPSRSLDFQYVSMMRPTFWSRFCVTNVIEWMSFGYGSPENKTKNMTSHLQLCFCTDSCLQLSILGTLVFSSHLWRPKHSFLYLHLFSFASTKKNMLVPQPIQPLHFELCEVHLLPRESWKNRPLKRWAWLPNYHCIKS